MTSLSSFFHTDYIERYRYSCIGSRVEKKTPGREWIRYLPGFEYRQWRPTALTQYNHVITMKTFRILQQALAYRVRYSRLSLNDNQLLELDHAGRLISCEAYYPFGGTALWTTHNHRDTRSKTLRYGGKERDASGLYYYGFRYFAPWLMRWINPDPVGPLDGLNLWRMCCNNPVTNSDSDGRMTNDQSDALPSFEVKELSDLSLPFDPLPDTPEYDELPTIPLPTENNSNKNISEASQAMEFSSPLTKTEQSSSKGAATSTIANTANTVREAIVPDIPASFSSAPGNKKPAARLSLYKYANKCEHCGSRYKSELKLKLHIKYFHVSPQLPPTCEECGVILADIDCLINHMDIHIKNKFPCPVDGCSKICNQKTGLANHIRNVHGDKNFYCQPCKLGFSNLKGLLRHNKMHDPSRRFPCQYCPLLFSDSNKKKNHEKTIHKKGLS